MKIQYVDGALLKKAFIGAANFLEQNKEDVNALNVFPVPDGDTGTNMSLTLQSAMKEIFTLNEYSVEKVAIAASNGSLMGARGNSGVILSQLFRGLANGLKGKEKVDAKVLAKAFKLASDTAYKAVMKPTEGTILTVARECAEAAITLSKEEKDIIVFFDKVIQQGNIALNKTPDMLPVLKEAGVVDAGGMGLMIILTGAFKALTTNGEIKYESVSGRKSEDIYFKKELSTGDIKFGYCTEFIVKNTKEDVENFKQELSKYGDSLLVVGGNGLIKVHVHTNNPGLVLEKGLSIGELHDIKIDNMRVQHRNLLVEEECDCVDEKGININEKKEKKKYSFITVAMGNGIANIFKELNVDFIIPGGQTMNPSTEDILNGIKKVEGENIIILPNNGNIVLAAEQAQKMSERKVYVFPTKSIPEGIAALIAFNPEISVEENLENMKLAVENVKTGQVTYAVRDTEINGKKISKDDIIGICKGDIKSSGKDVQETSLELLKKMVDEDNELITIFYGDTIEEKEANELGKLAEKEFENCDIEIVYGGQPIYYYIFSVE